MISAQYRDQLRKKHESCPEWGTSGAHLAPMVCERVKDHGHSSVLDYGCGKGDLLKAVGQSLPQLVLRNYDPGVAGFSLLPTSKYDLVVCSDVLEHVEPEHIEDVLWHIKLLTKEEAFLVVHTGPASHVLPDGRNAHILQRPWKWWDSKLKEYFLHVQEPIAKSEHVFHFWVKP